MGVADWFSLPQQSSFRQRLQDPYYRFRSLEEVRLAAAQGIRLDVNRATVDDWLRLPGLSIHQARLLVDLNRSGVAFHCLEDIAAALDLPVQYLQPIAPVLQFCYYDSDDLAALPQVNPNLASFEQLLQLPGMPVQLAQLLLRDRQRHGQFRNLVDFQQRLQLPGSVIADWMHYLRFR